MLASHAILTRIREVLTQGEGLLRVPTEGTFRGEFHEAMTPYQESLAGLTAARVSVSVPSFSVNEASPPIVGSFQLYNVEVRIRCVRTFDSNVDLSDEARDRLQGLAALDGDVIQQALSYPGNLLQTAAGGDTGLVSGALQRGTSTLETFEFIDGQNGRVVTQHTFTGVACVQTAIAPTT